MPDLSGCPFLITEEEFSRISVEALQAQRGQRLERTLTVHKRGNTAIMNIHGVISRYDSFLNWLRGGTAVEDLALDFKTALKSQDVDRIVLDIDSPGGEVAGIYEFAEMVHAADKPVTAYVGSQAASAAYWIASAADKIIANPTAELGSIGVVFGYRPSEDKTIEIVSTASPKKRLDPGSKEGRAEIQQRADDLAEIFIAQVAKYRGVTTDKVKNDFGQGGMMIAEKAISAGMADKIGSLEDIIQAQQNKGVKIMGLKTELRTLIVGKEDDDIEAAMASVGFIPKEKATVNDEKLKDEVMAAVKEDESKRINAIMEKVQIAKVSNPAFITELLALSPEEAGKKIIDAQADISAMQEIFSTVNPLADGGDNNLLIANAKKRAEGK